MGDNFDHENLSVNGRFSEDGTQYRLYVLVNGQELPLQYLNVHDYRETFDAAKQAPEDADAKKKSSG